jgi:hypothetical protein
LGHLWTFTSKDFPERADRGSRGNPKGAKENPRAPQGAPKTTKGKTKEGQKEPNGVPEGPRRCAWLPKGSSKENYINKNSRSNAPAAAMLLFGNDLAA